MCNSQPHTTERTGLYLVHWASNATATIEIFQNAHQKKSRYIV